MPPFLLGVSLSLQDRALGGAYTFAHRKRPAFFVSGLRSFAVLPPLKITGHSLVRRISNSPEVAQCSCQIVPSVIIHLQPEIQISGRLWRALVRAFYQATYARTFFKSMRLILFF